MLDDDKPHYVCCTDSGVYKDQMRKIDYDTLEKTFAFSPNTGKFINPAKEFRFLIGDFMEMDKRCRMEFSMTDDDILMMLPDVESFRNRMTESCPAYAEIAVEKWNS